MAWDMISGIGVVVAILALYFLPSIIAWRRNHNNENPIILTNLFFGWTFIGWIACLIWSFSDNVPAE